MNKGKLDTQEKDLLTSYERGEWQTVPNSAEAVQRYRQAARVTLRKDARVNIRISSKDL